MPKGNKRTIKIRKFRQIRNQLSIWLKPIVDEKPVCFDRNFAPIMYAK